MKISYDGKSFCSRENSAAGEVGPETVFHYHQRGNIVWADYAGGRIVRGMLIAICDDAGVLDARYQHINRDGELMTGVCTSTPQMLDDGRIRLHERWRWTCGGNESGESVVEELTGTPARKKI